MTKYCSKLHELLQICKKLFKTQGKTQILSKKNPQNSGKNGKTSAVKLKTQAKNSRFRQIHLVELPKTGPNKMF